MGRHSTGKNNYSLSKEVIAVLAALAVLIAAVVAWQVLRDSDNDAETATGAQSECVSGDLTLPVAAADKSVGDKLIEDYAGSHPVVRDYCVKPEYVDSLAQAAVYVAPVSPISRDEIAAAERSSTTNSPVAVYASPVGIAAHNAGFDAQEADIDGVVFPTREQPEASAIVARRLADSDDAAVHALKEQRINNAAAAASKQEVVMATTQDNTPDELIFSPIGDKELVYAAFPLNTTDDVNEEQSRAAQAFSDYAGKMFIDAHGDVQADNTGLSGDVWAAAAPSPGGRIADPQDESGARSESGALDAPTTTLFLLDTSSNMSSYNDPAAEAIDSAAESIIGAGHEVALWNYSSPLNAGVNKGYRANVAFTDQATKVTGTASRFTNGGQPLTREAVAAAAEYAGSVASADAPVRIVLITSGTADSNYTYTEQALADAMDKGVSLTIVHVGEDEADEELAAAAEYVTGVAEPEEIDTAIRNAAGMQ